MSPIGVPPTGGVKRLPTANDWTSSNETKAAPARIERAAANLLRVSTPYSAAKYRADTKPSATAGAAGPCRLSLRYRSIGKAGTTKTAPTDAVTQTNPVKRASAIVAAGQLLRETSAATRPCLAARADSPTWTCWSYLSPSSRDPWPNGSGSVRSKCVRPQRVLRAQGAAGGR